MDSFCTLIQLLTAFNYALVTSNLYLHSINKLITGYLYDVENHLSLFKEKIEETKSFLNTSIEVNTEKLRILTDEYKKVEAASGNVEDLGSKRKLMVSLLEKLSDQKKILENDFVISQNTCIKDYNDELKSGSTSLAFQAYSLYAAIYGTIFLFIYGFEKLFSQLIGKIDIFCNEMIFIFNIISILFILKQKSNEKRWLGFLPEKSLKSIFYIIFISLIISFVVTLIFYYIIGWKCNFNLYTTLIMMSVFICSAHYLLFLFKAFFRNVPGRVAPQIIELQTQIHKITDFKGQIAGALDVVSLRMNQSAQIKE